ncbi:MAG: sugar nucleotide-binding protein, partial [Pseudomonadota bacterium]|nr:sugar nucleotide-binding protein [Pseudomonadota bacterium]
NGEATSRDDAFTADDRPQPEDEYGRSKWRGEQRMFEIAAQRGMEALAIRSPLVYGPEVRANFLRLMQLVHRGIPLPLGAVDNRRSMISVWNLCDLIAHAARATSTGSAVLMASDGEDLSTAQLIRYLAAAMSRRPRLIAVPPALLNLMGRLTGKQAEVSRLTGSLRVDCSAVQLRLQWRPPLSVQEGIERTARWFVAERVANGS